MKRTHAMQCSNPFRPIKEMSNEEYLNFLRNLEDGQEVLLQIHYPTDWVLQSMGSPGDWKQHWRYILGLQMGQPSSPTIQDLASWRLIVQRERQ